MKFFKKLILRTGYNPFNYFNRGLIIALYFLPILFISVSELPVLGIVSFVFLFALLVVRNLKLKKIGYIILFTILQLILGLPLLLLFCYQIYQNMQGNYKQTNKAININYAENSWAGSRAFDEGRARELGYENVDEAIENGMAYNGVKLF